MIPKLILAVSAAMVAAALAGPASAKSFEVPRPPATLSPDLTEAWLLQMKPGNRAVVSDPVPRRGPLKAFFARARGVDAAYLPRIVDFPGKERPGTIIIDTNSRFLYLVLEDGKAKRYGVGVGRPGFEWAGVHTVTRKAEWPTWTPPDEMRVRQPYLPVSMKGGPANPLGARALYLGDTEYRIHGSNEPWTIGKAVSSGCIRMRNEDVIDLYSRVKVGTRVIVM